MVNTGGLVQSSQTMRPLMQGPPVTGPGRGSWASVAGRGGPPPVQPNIVTVSPPAAGGSTWASVAGRGGPPPRPAPVPVGPSPAPPAGGPPPVRPNIVTVSPPAAGGSTWANVAGRGGPPPRQTAPPRLPPSRPAPPRTPPPPRYLGGLTEHGGERLGERTVTTQEQYDTFRSPIRPPVFQHDRGTWVYTGRNGVVLIVGRDGTVVTSWRRGE